MTPAQSAAYHRRCAAAAAAALLDEWHRGRRAKLARERTLHEDLARAAERTPNQAQS